MIIHTYKDLCVERRICLENINALESILENFKKKMIKPPSGYKPIDYDGMPHGNSAIYSFDVIVEKYNNYVKELENERELYDKLTKTIEYEKKLINNLDAMDYRVVYDRLILGKTYREMADEYFSNEGAVQKLYQRAIKKGRV